MLFKGDSDKDVGRRYGGKQKMPCGHDRSGPEEDEEAEIDRVTYQIVEKRRFEAHRRHWLADEIVGDLMQAKEFKVVDKESADKHEGPAEQAQRQQ